MTNEIFFIASRANKCDFLCFIASDMERFLCYEISGVTQLGHPPSSNLLKSIANMYFSDTLWKPKSRAILLDTFLCVLMWMDGGSASDWYVLSQSVSSALRVNQINIISVEESFVGNINVEFTQDSNRVIG